MFISKLSWNFIQAAQILDDHKQSDNLMSICCAFSFYVFSLSKLGKKKELPISLNRNLTKFRKSTGKKNIVFDVIYKFCLVYN